MINGMRSAPFRITRGIRQGDPMSCLLFNLAIEPLATAIRDSSLKGLEIPGLEERLITSLFADDTTVFLSEDDEFKDLQRILNKWCIAAGAKFNIAKTQILPLGGEQFRLKMNMERRGKPDHEQIPNDVHIAMDNDSIWILGAWYGYDTPGTAAWNSQLTKIDCLLELWNKANPTLDGRKKVVQMVVGGVTQYLSQVQGMPKNTEKLLTKRIRQLSRTN